jgi:enterochelin esterase family protein
VANRNRTGAVQSVVELPGAATQTWLHPRPGVPRGTTTRREAPGGRTVWVYTPAGLAHRDLPVLVAFDGDVWTGPQDLPTTLDNLIHDGELPPTLAVLVDAGSRERRWAELDEDGRIDDWLVADLLPWVREEYPVSPLREDVTVAGQSLGALSALWALVRHPDAVGAVVSQSASLWQDAILDAVPTARLSGTRVYLEVGRQEWVLRPPHGPLAERMGAAGATVELVEFNGGHDYACWRGGIADGLRHTARWTS